MEGFFYELSIQNTKVLIAILLKKLVFVSIESMCWNFLQWILLRLSPMDCRQPHWK